MSEADRAKDAVEKAISEWDRGSLEVLLKGTPSLCSEALISTVWNGVHQIERVKKLVDDGISKESRLNTIASGMKELVKLTLELGADPNSVRQGSHVSIFAYACEHATKEVVKLMMDHRADWNFKHQSWYDSSIQRAFASGREEIIELFLDSGIDGIAIDQSDLLHHYCQSKSPSFDLFLTLVQLGADICRYGESAYDYVLGSAILGGNLKIIKFLINNDASGVCNGEPLIDAIETERLDVVELLLYHLGYRGTSRRYNLETPIAVAARTGNEEIVKLLLKRGGPRNVSALESAITGCNANILRILLNEGFNTNALIHTYVTHGRIATTLLSFAVLRGRKECVMVLLDHGVRIDDNRSENGKTALHYAAEEGHREIAELLLGRGADINDEDNDGSTPVSAAIQHEHYEFGKFLVRQMVYLKYWNEYVSEANLNAVKGNDVLKKFYNRCVNEMEKLKNEKLPDSFLSYFDLVNITNDRKLAVLLNNENLGRAIVSHNFKSKFPIYRHLVYDRFFAKDFLKIGIFELFQKFVNYLSNRDHDQLPALPFPVVSKIFTYLSDDDVTNLLNI